MADYRAGQIIKFDYSTLPTATVPAKVEQKEIFVLNPEFLGKTHGLDLSMLLPADREVLELVMDPGSKGKVHRIPLVNDILRRMDPIQEIKNPVSFYAKFVKPFLLGKDVYRTYWHNRMTNVVVVKGTHVQGQMITPKPVNDKPLFHGVEHKTTTKVHVPRIERPTIKVNVPKIQRPKKGKVV